MGRRVVVVVASGALACALLAHCGALLTPLPSTADSGVAPEPTPLDATGVLGPGDAAADAPSGFCDTWGDAATLCLDFDEGRGPGDGFADGPGSTVTVGTDFFLSPPASLHVFGTDDSSMWRRLPASATTYDFRFDVRFAADEGGNGIGGDFTIPLRFDTGDCAIDIYLSGSGRLSASRWDKSTPDVGQPLVHRPTPGKWSNLRMVVSRHDAGVLPSGTLEVDNEQALESTPLELPCAFTDTPKLTFGLLFGKGVEANLDNLVVVLR
jgi:hypothetical protein